MRGPGDLLRTVHAKAPTSAEPHHHAGGPFSALGLRYRLASECPGVRRTEEVLSSASEQTLQAMVGELRAEIRRAIDPSKAVLELERIEDLADDLNFEQRLDLLPSFAEALANTPAYAAYMVADRGGRLFLVARAKEPKGGWWCRASIRASDWGAGSCLTQLCGS